MTLNLKKNKNLSASNNLSQIITKMTSKADSSTTLKNN